MDRRSVLALVASLPVAGCTAATGPGRGGGDGRTPAGDCPPVHDVDRTVCPGVGSGPLAVDRSTASVSGDDWTLRVSVTNRADVPYDVNPFAWSLRRRRDAGWDRASATGAGADRVELPPDAAYDWSLSPSGDGPADVDHRIFAALDPGTYAFAVPFTGPTRVAAAAGFVVSA